MKRILVMLLLCCFLLSGCVAGRQIGVVGGPEFDYIIIDDEKYLCDYSDKYQNFSIAHKGDKLGIVSNGRDKMRVFSVKGDAYGNFLYVSWGYEGNYYVKESYVQSLQ